MADLDALVLAHRILVQQDVLDAFGHISVRDSGNTDLFWLARALPPSLVTATDMIAFDMDGEPKQRTVEPLFIERFIHSEIYRVRPDIGAICHHHASSVMPFCLTSRPLFPVSQSGAFMGGPVSMWDSAAEFGDTGMLVTDRAQGRSLAAVLGDDALVLMRGHGATVVGSGIKEMVFRSVYSCREADIQRAATTLGELRSLSRGEIEKARNIRSPVLDRCWSHWLAAMPAPTKGALA
jgi:ribulose-5-phosphate 4-epimerase/fuculose-1-phosphate aldolase